MPKFADLEKTLERVKNLRLSGRYTQAFVQSLKLAESARRGGIVELPLPHAETAVRHVAERVQQVQDRLRRRIALENVSTYVRFAADEMSEWEFLVAVAERADCGILLDVNNVFVNACNHGFDARAFLDAIPPERVFQIHLAGHSVEGPLRIDTHDARVCDEVWALYAYALARTGPVSTLIEWDDRIPPLATLEAEAARARAVIEAAEAARAGGHAA